jgi:quercetin dioxygenase-like cupin family protein
MSDSEIIVKTWGHEQLIHNGDYCMKLLVYTRQIASSLHYHERKHETFFISSGVFWVEVDGELRNCVTGDVIVLPPNTRHRVRCIQPGVIVEASSHDDPLDCVRLEPSES